VSLTFAKEGLKHKHGEGNPMIAGHRCSQSLVVTGQASEASRPSEGTLYYPSSRQQHKTSFGFMMFDYFQMQALFGGGGRRLFSGVTLVHVSNLHILCSSFLDSLGQLRYLCAVLLVSRGHFQSQKMSQSIHSCVNL
jgi:hypothetical protein